jgi:hypothetical protein
MFRYHGYHKAWEGDMLNFMVLTYFPMGEGMKRGLKPMYVIAKLATSLGYLSKRKNIALSLQFFL